MKFSFFIFFIIILNISLNANNNEIVLTKEEYKFLVENQPLKIQNELNWPPYNFNENGIPKGFAIDYMNLLAKKLNIKIKYITGPSWDEFMEMLKKDEIDAIINISKNKEREKYFDFSNIYHLASNAIYVKKGNETLDSLEKLEGKTIVMPKGFFAQEYLEKNYPNIHQILVKDSLEALKLLSLGKADATIDKKNVLDYLISTKNISEVIPTNYIDEDKLISHIRIATSKNKPLLNTILIKAQNSVSDEELLNLKKKWFGTTDIKNEKNFLTNDEKNYINKHSIKICHIIDLKPIEFFENNQFQGINIDLLNLIAKKLAIKFEDIKVNDYQTAINYLKNGTCDILPTTIENTNLKNIALLTTPILSYKLAIITQKNKPVVQNLDEIINKTMSKKSTSETLNLLKSKYPNINIFETSNDYETLEAVNNNKVYYAVEPLPVITYYMSKYALNDIYISRYTDMTLNVKFAILKENYVLYEIFNKTISQIKEYEYTTISNKWTNSFFKDSYDYSLLWKVLSFIFIILSVLTYRQVILNKHNRLLKLANNEIAEKTKLIEKQKELFEKLYNKSADGVLLIKDNKIIDCNEASLKILQYEKDELLNKFLPDISPKYQLNMKESSIKAQEKINEVLKNGICSFEWIHQNKDSEKLWIEVVLTAIEIDNISVIHTVIRDINKRKKMEKELESLTYKLEERIEEEIKKNKEKTNQLIQQSRLAQMGEMISMIAHQWRQPLSAISATTNTLLLKLLLDEKIDNEQLKKELNLIIDYSQHLSLTIDDFRNFFKTDKIKSETTLEELIEKSVNIIKTSFVSKNIELKINNNFNEKIITYTTELQQVILIILKNAEDAFIERRIKNKKIRIKTYKEADSIIIQIKDNAGGISLDIIDKVFDPYFSTKKEKEGTGIGLYMSKIIIDDHCKGNLSVINSENGALFTIKLPLSL